jgi:hypothetical protein
VCTAHSGLPLGQESASHLYLGTVAGEPVATVKLFYAAGVAYIGRVVTVPAFRRLSNRSSDGLAYWDQYLSPLGFPECCVVSTYAWNPESNQAG